MCNKSSTLAFLINYKPLILNHVWVARLGQILLAGVYPPPASHLLYLFRYLDKFFCSSGRPLQWTNQLLSFWKTSVEKLDQSALCCRNHVLMTYSCLHLQTRWIITRWETHEPFINRFINTFIPALLTNKHQTRVFFPNSNLKVFLNQS